MPCIDMPLEKLQSYMGRNPRPDDFDEFFTLTKLLFARFCGVEYGFGHVGCQKAEHTHFTCQTEDIANANQEQGSNCHTVEVHQRDLCNHCHNVVKEYKRNNYRQRGVGSGSEFEIIADTCIELFVRKNSCRHHNKG